MNGELCKLKEQREGLLNHIKELENKRVETDIFNLDKLAPYYTLLEGLDTAILKLERECI